MFKFSRLIPNAKAMFTNQGCDDLADVMSANDDSALSEMAVGLVIWLQFQPTHDSLNSFLKDGEFWNRYTAAADLQGSYSEQGGWFFTPDGYFKMHKDGTLPRIDLGGDEVTELMPDFRGNENPWLAAVHGLICRIHNYLRDQGYEWNEARRINIAITNVITDEFIRQMCGPANDVAIENLISRGIHKSLEWNFAFARAAHAMCPETIQGKNALVRGMFSSEVDLRALFDGSEKAKALTPSVSLAMRDMQSVAMKKNIIKRTLGRTVELGLPSFGECARLIRMNGDLTDEEFAMPIWPGLLYEAQRTTGGATLGPVGSQFVLAGTLGHLRENMKTGDGLWYDIPESLGLDNSDRPMISKVLDMLAV